MHVDIVSSTTALCLQYPHSNVKHGRIMTRLIVTETVCLPREANTLKSMKFIQINTSALHLVLH
jgi:hypothetical protein